MAPLGWGSLPWGSGPWGGGPSGLVTIASVTPGYGHTGGQTLVEIVGSGFRVQDASDVPGPVPARPPTVGVAFGGVAATNVAVASSTLLYCQTPIQDERVIETAWTSTASLSVLASVAHGLANGTSVRLVGDGARVPAPFDPDRVYFVVGASADAFSLAETAGGVAITATAAGDGIARSVGAYDVVVQNLDDDGAPIAGEYAVAESAFAFVLPDLSADSDLSRVVEALVLELRRQVIREVVVSVHSDYDAETGDALNVADVATLPALILAGPQLVENRFYSENGQQEVEVDDETFVTRAVPYVVDAIFRVYGLSDRRRELLNLSQAVLRFFRKNPYLSVQRNPLDATAGVVRFEIDFQQGDEPALASRGSNSNLGSFAGTILIRAIPIEDMPGLGAGAFAPLPTSLPHEPTTSIGKTCEIVDVGTAESVGIASSALGREPDP